MDVSRKESSSGYGEVLVCVKLITLLARYSLVLQLVLCAIPVFFKVPGAHIDLGGRTEGERDSALKELQLTYMLPQGFVTNRRLLLSSSGMMKHIFHLLPLTIHMMVYQMLLGE